MLTFTEHLVQTSKGPRLALVAEPTAPVRVGRERLKELHRGVQGSDLDQAVLDEVARRTTPAQIFVFRGNSHVPERAWSFEPDLSDADVQDLGYLILRSHLRMYRRLMSAGIYVNLFVEWGPRETDAFREGTRRLIDELEQAVASAKDPESPNARIARVDLWIVRHLTFFFAVRFERVIEQVLPEKLPLLESRAERVGKMLAELPASALL